jgi:hypothetical protein
MKHGSCCGFCFLVENLHFWVGDRSHDDNATLSPAHLGGKEMQWLEHSEYVYMNMYVQNNKQKSHPSGEK